MPISLLGNGSSVLCPTPASSQVIPEPATVAAWFAFLCLLRCTGRKVPETSGAVCC